MLLTQIFSVFIGLGFSVFIGLVLFMAVVLVFQGVALVAVLILEKLEKNNKQ